jgi:membrane protein DedA with SNARE-associated domain
VALDFLARWPYPLALATLFVVVLLRAGATYALGRGAHAGADRTRLARLVRRPGFRRAERLVARWGAPVVTLSFLTVGVQTLVNLAAGLARMPLRRYLPALVVGGALWAFIYATVWSAGLAAWSALWELSPVAAIVVLVALALGLGGYVTWQVRRRAEEPDGTGAAEDDELAAHDGRARPARAGRLLGRGAGR